MVPRGGLTAVQKEQGNVFFRSMTPNDPLYLCFCFSVLISKVKEEIAGAGDRVSITGYYKSLKNQLGFTSHIST